MTYCFKKMARETLNSDPICWADEIVEHIGNNIEPDETLEVGDGVYGGEKQKLSAMPDSARHLYYLWWFNAYAGGCGLDGFILSRNEHEIRGAYEGFLAIGQPKVAQYMADAIGLALAYCDGNPDEVEWAYDFYEFTDDLSWFRSLPHSERFPEPAALAAAVAEHFRTEDDETEFDEEGNITNLSLLTRWQNEIDVALSEYCDAIDEVSGYPRFSTWLQQYVEQHFDELVE